MTANALRTSVVGESPEITAPVRLEGESNSDVLFKWLLVNRYLWMLDPTHDAELERLVGTRARLRLGYKLIEWRRQPNHKIHPALTAPDNDESRRTAFVRLERLIQVHLFDSGGPKHG